MSALLDAALVYAEAGWRIFPLRGKTPLIPKTEGGNGVRDATDDPDQVTAWWSRWPKANIGAAIPPSMCVVDVDPRNGGEDTWQNLSAGRHVYTLTVLSGRMDGGRHLWLRKPDGPIRASLGTGVDVKRSGGYTLLPPSVHPDSGMCYRWAVEGTPIAVCPNWLADALRQPVSPPRRNDAPGRHNPAGLLRMMAAAANGERNNVLFWAASRIVEEAGDPDTGLGRLADAAIAQGLPIREVERTIASARRRR